MPIDHVSSSQDRSVRVRLIAVDLDDTILSPDQSMTPRAVGAVQSARNAGIPIIPATSRGVLSAYEVLPLAAFGPLVVCANGAVTIDWENRTIIRERPIQLAVVHSVIEDLRTAIPSLSLAAETTTAFFGEEWIMKQAMRQSDTQVVEDTGSSLDQAPLKLFAGAPDVEFGILAAVIARTIKDRASLATKKNSWVELCAPGVSKALALDEVSSLLGVNQSSILAVGDAENDLDMIGWAGISAAVQNAVPSVLAAANLIIPSNSCDGVAFLLEELLANNFMLHAPMR
jgi:Cof subfamily protein (haloacid dehalogenase superfamily)